MSSPYEITTDCLLLVFRYLGVDGRLAGVIAGIFQAHLFHLCSVLVLYHLARRLCSSPPEDTDALPVISAMLHCITPAGAFLSAPYAESLFSLLNMAGFYLYVDGLLDHRGGHEFGRDLKTICSGTVFGIATTVRSNGLLSGAMFAYDAAQVLSSLCTNMVTFRVLRRLCILGFGGCLILAGTVYPQALAYMSYCRLPSGSHRREWCDSMLPSIYAWVQYHYW